MRAHFEDASALAAIGLAVSRLELTKPTSNGERTPRTKLGRVARGARWLEVQTSFSGNTPDLERLLELARMNLAPCPAASLPTPTPRTFDPMNLTRLDPDSSTRTRFGLIACT